MGKSMNDLVKEKLISSVYAEGLPSKFQWVVEKLMPVVISGIEEWVTEEYSSRLQEWITSDFSNCIEEWIKTGLCPSIEKFVKEYSSGNKNAKIE